MTVYELSCSHAQLSARVHLRKVQNTWDDVCNVNAEKTLEIVAFLTQRNELQFRPSPRNVNPAYPEHWLDVAGTLETHSTPSLQLKEGVQYWPK